MKVGDVFVWETDKAIGHDSRKKLQVFICSGDWLEDNTFLFISSTDYGGDFRISAARYEKFLTYDSFIACGSIVAYTDDELMACAPKFVGRLLLEDLRSLHDAVAASEVLEGRHILRVCAALRKVLD
jgi:hypothetical protein